MGFLHKVHIGWTSVSLEDQFAVLYVMQKKKINKNHKTAFAILHYEYLLSPNVKDETFFFKSPASVPYLAVG